MKKKNVCGAKRKRVEQVSASYMYQYTEKGKLAAKLAAQQQESERAEQERVRQENEEFLLRYAIEKERDTTEFLHNVHRKNGKQMWHVSVPAGPK